MHVWLVDHAIMCFSWHQDTICWWQSCVSDTEITQHQPLSYTPPKQMGTPSKGAKGPPRKHTCFVCFEDTNNPPLSSRQLNASRAGIYNCTTRRPLKPNYKFYICDECSPSIKVI